MAGRNSISWLYNSSVFSNWSKGKQRVFEPIIDLSRPTIRAIVCLALYEKREKKLSYVELRNIIQEKGVLVPAAKNGPEFDDELMALRVGVAEVAKSLRNARHPLQVKTTKVGRESRFQLISGSEMNNFVGDALRFSVRPMMTDPKNIAKALVRDGGELPFSAFYSTYRAAACWLGFSMNTGLLKKDYEAKAVERYGVVEGFLNESNHGHFGLISLAPGEGLGEVETLKKLLNPVHHASKKIIIDYLAVDSSDILLMSHSKLIADIFSEEIREGRLRYFPCEGNIYQLGLAMDRARAKVGDAFLSNIPILCTYFGNCIGNDERNEWKLVRSVLESISNEKSVRILIGASLVRTCSEKGKKKGELNIIEEKYNLDPFLLETPRYLLYDLELFHSIDKHGKKIDRSRNKEFLYDVDDSTGFVPSSVYDPGTGIVGRVYRFYYTLKNDLETWDGTLRLRKGERILLYSIIKYELKTLLEFYRSRGLKVETRLRDSDVLCIREGNEEFKYAVFEVSRTAKR